MYDDKNSQIIFGISDSIFFKISDLDAWLAALKV
jgi:hypothetical protein